MIASSFVAGLVTITCRMPDRTTCRSIDHLTPDSMYEPVISKLLDAARVPTAPFSRARVDGWPRPNGAWQADRATTNTAPAMTANARCGGVIREAMVGTISVL